MNRIIALNELISLELFKYQTNKNRIIYYNN